MPLAISDRHSIYFYADNNLFTAAGFSAAAFMQ
jgi:hypothetical protein